MHPHRFVGGEVLTLMDINEVDTLRITSETEQSAVLLLQTDTDIRLVNAQRMAGLFGQSIICRLKRTCSLIPAGSMTCHFT